MLRVAAIVLAFEVVIVGTVFTVIASDLEVETPFASVTVTVKVSLTADPLTVPEMTPVPELSVSPAGRIPVVTVQLRLAVPPETARVWEYVVWVWVAAGSGDVVKMTGAAFTVRVRTCVSEAPLTSVALTVKVDVAAVPLSGPVRTPVVALRVRPFGRVPDETLQVMAPVPPVTARVWE